MRWGHGGGLFIPGENSGPVSLSESAMQTGCAHSEKISIFLIMVALFHVATQEAKIARLYTCHHHSYMHRGVLHEGLGLFRGL